MSANLENSTGVIGLEKVSFSSSLKEGHDLLDHGKSKCVPDKYLLLLHWLYTKALDFVDHNKLCKILEEMGLPDPSYLSPEKPVCGSRSNSWNWTWNNGLVQNQERTMTRLCIVTLLFNWYAEYIMWNARLDESQAGMKIDGRNIKHLRYADDTTLKVEGEEELKRLLMKVKEDSEKTSLKLNIQKTNIMWSSTITAWQIEGKIRNSDTFFFFVGSKITVGSDCSHEMKRCLLLGGKPLTNLDSILKSRDTTFLTKVHIVKAMGGFSSNHVRMWGLNNCRYISTFFCHFIILYILMW